MPRPSLPLLVGILAVLGAGALAMVILAGSGPGIPRPAHEPLSGDWDRGEVMPPTGQPLPHAWSRLHEVEGCSIQPSRVAFHLAGAEVAAGVIRSAGGTMLVRLADGSEVTLGRLGQDGAVVMASGGAVVALVPHQGKASGVSAP